MNESFCSTAYILICMSTTLLSLPQPMFGQDAVRPSKQRPLNLSLVEVEKAAGLHRIASCTKAAGRLICKSGRFNYVINNGNFESPAPTLEKFVSALYQKAKDNESDFAVTPIAPAKEMVMPATQQIQMLSESNSDQLQPACTVECDLTDTKKLKETNPDYQPKPNERVFKCRTKYCGKRKRRTYAHVLIRQDRTHNAMRSKSNSATDLEPQAPRKKRSLGENRRKIFEPIRKRKKAIRTVRSQRVYPRDVVKRFGVMYQNPDFEDVGNDKYLEVAGYNQREATRPRVRDYCHSCPDKWMTSQQWCPGIKTTPCGKKSNQPTSTAYPLCLTGYPLELNLRKKYRVRRKTVYKFRNPFIDFFMPWGLRDFSPVQEALQSHSDRGIMSFHNSSSLAVQTVLNEDAELAKPSKDEATAQRTFGYSALQNDRSSAYHRCSTDSIDRIRHLDSCRDGGCSNRQSSHENCEYRSSDSDDVPVKCSVHDNPIKTDKDESNICPVHGDTYPHNEGKRRKPHCSHGCRRLKQNRCPIHGKTLANRPEEGKHDAVHLKKADCTCSLKAECSCPKPVRYRKRSFNHRSDNAKESMNAESSIEE